MTKRILFLLLAATLALSACGGGEPVATSDPNAIMTQAFATVNASFTQTALAVPTNTPLPTETPAPPSPTPPNQPIQFTPTATFLVTIKVQANCRFGPSTVYTGPGGLRSGKVLEAFGRDESAQWLLLREPGANNSCWVNVIALDLQGDPGSLAVAPINLPHIDKYAPPPNIAATRNSDQVTITWGEVTLNPKDTHLENRYFLELWLCSAGALTYEIRSTNDVFITVIDQPGCAEPSHGQISTATRSGYSQPAPIPWP